MLALVQALGKSPARLVLALEEMLLNETPGSERRVIVRRLMSADVPALKPFYRGNSSVSVFGAHGPWSCRWSDW